MEGFFDETAECEFAAEFENFLLLSLLSTVCPPVSEGGSWAGFWGITNLTEHP